MDWTSSGSPVSAVALPTQRGSGDVDVSFGRRADVTTELALQKWGWRLEAAATTLLGLGVVYETPDVLVAMLALGVWLVGAYAPVRTVTTPLREELRTIVVASLVPMAMLAFGAALGVPSDEIGQGLLSVALPATLAATIRTLRWTFRAPVRVVAVGDRAFVAKAVSDLPRRARSRVVAAIVLEHQLSPHDLPVQILGVPTYTDLDLIARVAADYRGDLVLVDSREVAAQDFRRLTWALEGTRIAVGVNGFLSGVAPHRLRAGSLGRDSVLDVRPPRPPRLVRGVKGALDRALGLAALVLVSPLLVLTMLAVRCDSRGPAIFRQTRVGMHGERFTVYKLRTMHVGAEEAKHTLRHANEYDDVLFKMRRDPRVTRVGHLLRRSSLDELPQLVNVLRGEMSLVGPRPMVPSEVAEMRADSLRRLSVKPGLTGLWQVSGRSDLSWSDSIAFDLHYIDNWTLVGDAQIAARTVKAVLGAKGAY